MPEHVTLPITWTVNLTPSPPSTEVAAPPDFELGRILPQEYINYLGERAASIRRAEERREYDEGSSNRHATFAPERRRRVSLWSYMGFTANDATPLTTIVNLIMQTRQYGSQNSEYRNLPESHRRRQEPAPEYTRAQIFQAVREFDAAWQSRRLRTGSEAFRALTLSAQQGRPEMERRTEEARLQERITVYPDDLNFVVIEDSRLYRRQSHRFNVITRNVDGQGTRNVHMPEFIWEQDDPACESLAAHERRCQEHWLESGCEPCNVWLLAVAEVRLDYVAQRERERIRREYYRTQRRVEQTAQRRRDDFWAIQSRISEENYARVRRGEPAVRQIFVTEWGTDEGGNVTTTFRTSETLVETTGFPPRVELQSGEVLDS